MKKVELEETNNGYIVWIRENVYGLANPYVFKSTELLDMLAFVGKYVVGQKLDVREK